MNLKMEDVHNDLEKRNISIERVGINNLKLPFCYNSLYNYNTIATIVAGVYVKSNEKGAHLSRIVEVLNETFANKILNIRDFSKIIRILSDRIEENDIELIINFPTLIETLSPVTKKINYIDSETELKIIFKNDVVNKDVSLRMNGSMCCPSSKKISKYGAHSQRCLLKSTIVDANDDLLIEDIANIVQKCFSVPVFSVVKREDEKYMTETSYENPKFSEDLIRDVLLNLKRKYKDSKIIAEMENYESIHSHNVYAKGYLK